MHTSNKMMPNPATPVVKRSESEVDVRGLIPVSDTKQAAYDTPLPTQPAPDPLRSVDPSSRTFVDYLVVSGLDPELVKQHLGGEPDLEDGPLDRAYPSTVLQHLPETCPWNAPFNTDIATLCFPAGLHFKLSCDDRRSVLHPFVMTKEDGSRTYGMSLTFYEEVLDTKLVELLNVLQQIHDYQTMNAADEPYSFSPMSSPTGRRKSKRRSSSMLFPAEQVASSEMLLGDTFKRVYAPTSISIVSQIPAIAAMEQCLLDLYTVEYTGNKSLQGTTLAQMLLSSIPLPPPGWSINFKFLNTISLTNPGVEELPLCQCSFRRLFGLFTPETIVKLFTCVLLEQQIVLVSSDYEVLMLVSECLTTLLYPFAWPNAYVPIVPEKELQFLEAPVPYIMGIHSDFLESDLGTMECLVDIDNGSTSLPEDLPTFPFSKPLIESLKDLVKSSLRKSTSVAPPETDVHSGVGVAHTLDDAMPPPFATNDNTPEEQQFRKKVRDYFCQTFCYLFKNIDSYIIAPEERYQDESAPVDEVFDKLSFISDQPKENVEFLLRFTESQIFDMFLSAQGFSSGKEASGISLLYFKEQLAMLHSVDGPTSIDTTSLSGEFKHLLRLSASLDKSAGRRSTSSSSASESGNVNDIRTPNDRGSHLSVRTSSVLSATSIYQTERHTYTIAIPTAAEEIAQSPPRVSHAPPGFKSPTLHVSKRRLFEDLPSLKLPPRNLAHFKMKFEEANGTPVINLSERMVSSKSTTSLLEKKKLSNGSTRPGRLARRNATAPAAPVTTTALKTGVKDLVSLSQPSSATHDNYHHRLMQEVRERVKTCVLAALDVQTAVSMGYAAAACCDHTVFSLCESLDRVWKHGARATRGEGRGKSCFWSFLQGASEMYASTNPEFKIQDNVNAVTNMGLQTDVGRARAWARLCIEQKALKTELDVFLSSPAVVKKFYKRYAFLMQEDYRERLLTQLLSLTTVDLHPFSPKYPDVECSYMATLLTAKSLRGGGQGGIGFIANGSLLVSKEVTIDKGTWFDQAQECSFRFSTKNLGVLESIAITYQGTGWALDRVSITNLFTKAVVHFDGFDGAVVETLPDGSGATIALKPVVGNDITSCDRNPKTSLASALGLSQLSPEQDMQQDVMQENIAAAVNTIIRAYMLEEGMIPSPSKRALLLLGGGRISTSHRMVPLNANGVDSITEGGLCKTLLHCFRVGFKASTFLGGDRHPWDMITKFAGVRRKELENERKIKEKKHDGRRSVSGTLTPMNNGPALSVEDKLLGVIDKANRASPRISKAVRFEFLVCAGASYHVLHVWFKELAEYAPLSSMYEPHAMFYAPDKIEAITEMMRCLIDFPFDLLGKLQYVKFEEGAFWQVKD
eukprot:m.81642 g.81642  ORF g.81642 m.81642 type:complete len:1362 (-) comp25439_c0_seq1:67-4152(-)